MSVQTSDTEFSGAAFDALEINRLTWIGLIVAGIGWAALIGEATVSDVLVSKVPRAMPPTFHADLFDIAKCVIASGFGLAIIGALQSGFGTLNRFFSAVLIRSSQRAPRGMESNVAAPPSSAPVRERRPYRLMADGSVEVETIVGTRRFATMHEAREFI